MQVLTDFELYITPERILLQSIEGPNELISIDRLTNEISLANGGQIPADASSKRLVKGVVGVIRLIAGPYLIVITGVEHVGTIFGQPVYRIAETDIIPFCKTTLHLTDEQAGFNSTYLAMVKSVLDTQYFYFCKSYDLTHTIQRLHSAGPAFLSMSLFDRADERFIWNRSLLTDFATRPELKRYCLPIVHGFISIKTIKLNSKQFSLIIVSRRNINRAGTRLFKRGIDDEGNPANYVETEQIVEFENYTSAFVQIRGSIPLYWSQLPNLKYKPAPILNTMKNQMEGFQKHMDHVLQHYGPFTMLNLINHTGQEQPMEREFTRRVKELSNNLVRYEAFDFHHECRKMRWDRLSILMDRISSYQEDYGYFLLSPERAIISQQEGIFRTNCIDSLDRTNVVQGLLAKRSLEQQLAKLGLFQSGERIEHHPPFENIYRNVWADNADIVSAEYSGTGALKTDFTRTGKRTQMGALRDGVNSMTRYFKNNFADGFRQDAIDLFLGNYKVRENEGTASVPCPLQEKKDWKYLAFPAMLLGSIAMFFFSMFITSGRTESLFALLFWGVMSAGTVFVIYINNNEFIDFPKLCYTEHLKPTRRSTATD